jgi:hypothetical protein
MNTVVLNIPPTSPEYVKCLFIYSAKMSQSGTAAVLNDIQLLPDGPCQHSSKSQGINNTMILTHFIIVKVVNK